MVTSTRTTLATISSGMPPERACSLARSDVVSYDNLTRVANPAMYTYNGGPNLNTTYTGSTGYQSLIAAYVPRRADKLRIEWSYSIANLIAIGAAIKPKTLGGNINGLVNNGAELAQFGARTLYGTRYAHTGGLNSLADITDTTEQARLLGDDPAAATYSDNMRGISDWRRASSSIGVMLHDDPQCMWGSHVGGGSFRDSTFAGFTGHAQAADYRTYLRSLYANDAAYDAARTAGTVPAYTAARQWLLDQVFAWHVKARARANGLGMEYVLNIAGALPNKHPQCSAALLNLIDYGMCELQWQSYTREGTSARMPSDRAAAENLSDATTLRRSFAAMALTAQLLRGAGRKATFAPNPLIDWLPPKSGGAGSAPSTSAYTVPTKVARQQFISWAWLQALGFPSIIPSGVFDEAAGDVIEYGFTGYVGNVKPLYYMAPSLAATWFSWVAASAEILDGFDLAATVAIVQPLSTNFWRGAVDGVGNYSYVWVDSYLRPLIEANVPFVILPVDDASGYPLSGYDLTKYQAIITASNNVLTLPGSLPTLAPVTVTGSVDATRPVLCVPRVDRARNRLALHVVNTHSCDYAANSGAGGAGTTQTAITLSLKTWAMLTPRIKSARWYSHESTLQGAECRISRSGQGATISAPPFLESGVIVLDFA